MNFKVGDRIRVYGLRRCRCISGPGTHSGWESEFVEGTVTQSRKDIVQFKSDDSFEHTAHPKQCRRLKKKEPITYWVNQYAGGLSCGHLSRALAEENADDDRTALLELRLVKRHQV